MIAESTSTDAKLSVIIMAAGKGTRMNSDLPKVLHPIAGKTLLQHVLDTAAKIGALRKIVVVGHQRELVIESVRDGSVQFAIQDPPLGTGHAVMQAVPLLNDLDGEVVVLSGDVPLLRTETINRLVSEHRTAQSSVTVLSTTAPNPAGYGRIVRDNNGEFVKIVEEREASGDVKQINEINSGIYCFNLVSLRRALPGISSDNSKGEFYLTDAIELIRKAGGKARAVNRAEFQEVCGINTVAELAAAEANYLARKE